MGIKCTSNRFQMENFMCNLVMSSQPEGDVQSTGQRQRATPRGDLNSVLMRRRSDSTVAGSVEGGSMASGCHRRRERSQVRLRSAKAAMISVAITA
ncbi:hypothetical protein TIFTF001_030253 [Ficus carica]|uniref:Uncharacterized protein n=1 Tax=Ficus carica TaxID=3494 RepID=A0AA88DT89_FICCA|nr:hypothetical protein TIFTF001_030253 [Ficus carica]